MVDNSPRQLATQTRLPTQLTAASAPIQRAIKKPRGGYTYKVFPGGQLRKLGMLHPHEEYARGLFESKKKYTLKETVRLAKLAYNTVNKGVRVAQKNAGTRLNSHADVIGHFRGQGQDTTNLETKFITNNHGPAFDALLTQVPLTDADLLNSSCAASTASSIYPDLTNFLNRKHVPTMVRTPSFLCETIDAMAVADTSGGTGYVSSNKGSMFEAFVAHNYIPGSSRVVVPQQGNMYCSRSSDGFAGNVLYDTKFYTGPMAIGTNNNQWADYAEIVTQGYTGSNNEIINSICYIFPNVLAARQNKHLKAANIMVAYPDKATKTLKYV